MPANDEFPRGAWLYSGRIANGPTASVVFPATPGIAWVIKEIHALLYFANTAVFSNIVNVLVNSTTYGVLMVEITTASATNQVGKDTFDWSGSFQFAAGDAVTVTFDTATSTVLGEQVNAYAEPV